MEKKVSPSKKQKGRSQALDCPQPLISLVDYQTGAIVSREILSRPAGTITLFAFDKGQQLSEHTAPFDALVVVLDGEAKVSIGGQTHRVSQGEMILMPANVPHAVEAAQKFKMILIMVRS